MIVHWLKHSMKTIHLEVPRVMAINMTNGRAGYAVFEGEHFLVDWGVLDLRGTKDTERLEKILNIIAWNLPDVVVLEDVDAQSCVKGDRTRNLLKQIAKDTKARSIETSVISRKDLQSVFESMGACTRHAIARIVVDRFPELKRRMPPVRRAWDSEPHNMTLFVAASFALAWFKHATN